MILDFKTCPFLLWVLADAGSGAVSRVHRMWWLVIGSFANTWPSSSLQLQTLSGASLYCPAHSCNPLSNVQAPSYAPLPSLIQRAACVFVHWTGYHLEGSAHTSLPKGQWTQGPQHGTRLKHGARAYYIGMWTPREWASVAAYQHLNWEVTAGCCIPLWI